MFAKIHNHQQHQYQQQHHHQLDHQISEEEESRSSEGGARSISKRSKLDPDGNRGGGGGGGEEGTIEVAKRPRGRPPGSKNKPKPPLIITRETECAMRPLFLELPGGLDIIDAIARFTHRRNIGLTVLTASGSVTNLSIRESSTSSSSGGGGGGGGGGGSISTFRGRFEILSISAMFLPPSLPITSSSTTSSPSILPSSFMISVVGPRGEIIGGSVAGSLVTAGTVFIVAASFDNPSYHRLPLQDDIPNSTASDQDNNDSNPMVDQSCGMSMYHVPPSDLIWTPTPRPPPPF